MRRLATVALLALGLALAGAAPAWAIPVKELKVTPSKPLLRFSARLMSPPNGGCHASAVAALFWAPRGGRQVRLRIKRVPSVNVCSTGTTGETSGVVTGTMRSATLPPGRYRFALAATASVAGQADTDVVNRYLFIPRVAPRTPPARPPAPKPPALASAPV